MGGGKSWNGGARQAAGNSAKPPDQDADARAIRKLNFWKRREERQAAPGCC